MFNKLLKSSEDPKYYSLFVKGLLVMGGGYLVKASDMLCALGLKCLGIDTVLVGQIADTVEVIVYSGLMLIGAVMGCYGLLRKFKLGRWSATE